jgi:hypothetical protein
MLAELPIVHVKPEDLPALISNPSMFRYFPSGHVTKVCFGIDTSLHKVSHVYAAVPICGVILVLVGIPCPREA